MANSIVQPVTGPHVIDLQHLQGVTVDVVPGATRGFRREKEGIIKVLAEVAAGIPAHAATLNIPADTHTQIATKTEQIAQVRAARATIDKWAEWLEETQAYLEDEREGQIGQVVDAVRGASRRKDPSVIAAFEETVRYHGQIAKRAYKTRRKNAEMAAEAEAETEAEADGTARS